MTNPAIPEPEDKPPLPKFIPPPPKDLKSTRFQIAEEYKAIKKRSDEHTWRAANWDTLASWLRMIVTLTSGISALSVFADNQIVAAVFASITAFVAAVNAGFNPPEKAKAHRDAARGYGHLATSLHGMMHALDPAPPAHKHESSADGDTAPGNVPALWAGFLENQEQIERIEEKAPVLRRRHTARRAGAG